MGGGIEGIRGGRWDGEGMKCELFGGWRECPVWFGAKAFIGNVDRASYLGQRERWLWED